MQEAAAEMPIPNPSARAEDGVIRTALGDRPADAPGWCDHHEHLFQVSPLLRGDEVDDESPSGREAAALRHGEIDSMVEATPTGLGREPAAVARVSRVRGHDPPSKAR